MITPDRILIEKVKIGIAAGALFFVIAAVIMARLKESAKKEDSVLRFLIDTEVVSIGRFRLNIFQSFVSMLLILATFSTINASLYGTGLKRNEYDSYDLLHYYITPKYFDELNYFRLVPALIVANHEGPGFCRKKVTKYLYEKDSTWQVKPVTHALERSEEIKSHFTEARWKEFVGDVSYLLTADQNINCEMWKELLQDHGFNGTPAGVLVARPLAQAVPVEHIRKLSNIDIALVGAALVGVGWAFGLQTAVFALLFFSLSYSCRWPVIGWSMLRYDWIVAIVLGICFTRKERFATAGLFFGYAALMRYFPAVWLLGIFAKVIHSVIMNRAEPFSRFWRRVPTVYYRMAAGFFAIVILMTALSFARDGVSTTKASFDNMSGHLEAGNLSSRRMGMAIAAAYRGETEMLLINNAKRALVGELKPLVTTLGLLMSVLLGVFLTRRKSFEAVSLGLLPFFWLTTSSYYYYVARVTGVIVHAQDLSKPRNVFGLFMIFFMELFSNATENLMPGNRYFHISNLCILLTIYTVGILVFLGIEWWKESHKPEAFTDADLAD